MEGRIQVAPGARAAVAAIAPDIVRDPTDLPSPPSCAPAGRAGRPADCRAEGTVGRQDHLRFLDIQRKGTRALVRVRVGDTVEVHQRREQFSIIGRLPRRHRSRWWSGIYAGRAGRGEDRHIQGVGARTVRLSLRDAKRAAPHHQRHVRDDPRGTGRRASAGGPRVLCHAGRALHGQAFRDAGTSGAGL